MSITVSNKFKEMILGPHSFADIFAGGRIELYSGDRPVSADDGVSGTKLATITRQDGAIEFDQDGAWVFKPTAHQWVVTPEVAGTATWFRLLPAGADEGYQSFSAVRIDGSVGMTSTADFIMVNTTLAVGTIVQVQQFAYTIPPVL